MKTGHVIPLLCTSLVFFLFVIIVAFRVPGPALHTIVPLIVAGISFCGSVLVVVRLRKESDRWYLGIFHVAAIGIICISAAMMLISLERNTDFLILSFALLPLTSVGFFIAFPKPQQKITWLFALISGVFSAYAIFLIYLIVSGLLHPLQTSWNIIGGYSAIFMMVFLPLIGLCHIGAALVENASS
jgi:hypothetical protein